MLQFLIHVRQYLPAFMELMHLPINIDQGDDHVRDGPYYISCEICKYLVNICMSLSFILPLELTNMRFLVLVH